MEGSAWKCIEEIDKTLSLRLQEHFRHPANVAATIEGEDDARSLVEQAVGGHFGRARRQAVGAALHGWSLVYEATAKRARLEKMEERERGESSTKAAPVDPGAAYEQLVTASPLGLVALQKYLRAQKKKRLPIGLRLRMRRRKHGHSNWLNSSCQQSCLSAR